MLQLTLESRNQSMKNLPEATTTLPKTNAIPKNTTYTLLYYIFSFYFIKLLQKIKDEVKFVLRIGSANNKGGPADINISQILHLLNFSDIKLWFVFIYERSKPEQIDIRELKQATFSTTRTPTGSESSRYSH